MLQSDEYGTLQRLVDALFAERRHVARVEVIGFAEICDLPADLMEIVLLLPPGSYTRQRLCDQMNSALAGHGWGLLYGTVQ
ncbi:MAG: hypothetical protein LBP28_04055 [Coriobacteriales bacterium]|jgi:hypothetical protein|nr:hypothetical protein [Coriobacteriales bacterium]